MPAAGPPSAAAAPVNLVNLERVVKGYGTRVLLDGVSLGVARGERTGVVGRNGDGKSTLLRLVAGVEPPDAGRVTHTGGLRLGMLAQHDDLDPRRTVREAVLGDAAPHEWASDAGVRDVLTGLLGGLDAPGLSSGLDTEAGALSGGERRRAALARVLVRDHDLLVLDEPTNHLDVEGIDWLSRHLVSRREALVVVTHDRWFLDTVCERTWEVADGAVREYDGGYSAYVLARAERARVSAAEESRRQGLLRKELAWLRRGPPARTSKPRFRVEAANALIADEPAPRDSVELVRFASSRLGRSVYEVRDATIVAGDRTLLDHLTWAVGPGDRIGVVGVNGSGKTTLLRTLSGDLAPMRGRVVTGTTVRAAHLTQAVTELDPKLRVLEAVEAVRRVVDLGGGRELTASQLCERFGFGGDVQWTPVGDLSGGQRRRLQLLRLLMDEPNVLLLDEPTNDLDIDTLTALEDLLDGWAGTLLVVSHDRWFLERTTDSIVALVGPAGQGTLAALPGGVEDYLRRRRESVEASKPPTTGPGGDGERRVSDAAAARSARKELARLERALSRLVDRERGLHDELAVHSTDHERVIALDARLRELVAERAALEDAWLHAAETAHPSSGSEA